MLEYLSHEVPVGFETRSVSERQLRTIQLNLRAGYISSNEMSIVDACISYVCNHAKVTLSEERELTNGIP